jgi:hypothetical protein
MAAPNAFTIRAAIATYAIDIKSIQLPETDFGGMASRSAYLRGCRIDNDAAFSDISTYRSPWRRSPQFLG